MAEPVTTNKAFIVPNTGDLPGLWGSQALNPDLIAIDGIFGGFATISLSSGSVTLSVPAGFTATPGPGPTQSQNALIRLTGALGSAAQVVFPMPGFYIVENLCTGAFPVTLASVGVGNVIGAPPNQKIQVFNDGLNVDYVSLPPIGTYLDMAATAVPPWIGASSVPPYLNCNGSTFSSATYPQLALLLGGTTLPDSRGRTRFALSQTTGRITNVGGNGIDGTTLLAAGGSQALLQAMFPAFTMTVSIPGGQGSHSHVYQSVKETGFGGGGGAQFDTYIAANTNASALPAMTGTAATGGSAAPLLPPGYVGGLTLIRAG